MNNNAPTIRCIRLIASGILTPFGRVCISRKQLSYNRADENKMDSASFGRIVVGRMLGRGRYEFDQRDAWGRTVTHGRAAYDAIADTTRR